MDKLSLQWLTLQSPVIFYREYLPNRSQRQNSNRKQMGIIDLGKTEPGTSPLPIPCPSRPYNRSSPSFQIKRSLKPGSFHIFCRASHRNQNKKRSSCAKTQLPLFPPRGLREGPALQDRGSAGAPLDRHLSPPSVLDALEGRGLRSHGLRTPPALGSTVETARRTAASGPRMARFPGG